MFTGLIEELGTIATVHPARRSETLSARITVEAPSIPSRLKTGDSVAVSGVCLTAVEIDKNRFTADLAEETLQRTSLGNLATGAIVNLELPAPAGAPLGGHIVQGHVDGIAKLVSLDRVKDGEDWRLALEIPSELARYVMPQGSITIEGISLTVATIRSNYLEIAIIPHTYRVTNLHTLRSGDALNIETDVLAKYAEKMTQAKAGSRLTVADLIRQGF